MPVESRSVSVGTALTEISGPSIQSKIVYLQDGDYGNASEVFVGGTAVSASTGVKLSKANVSVFQINADDAIYAIGDSATSSVRVTEVS